MIKKVDKTQNRDKKYHRMQIKILKLKLKSSPSKARCVCVCVCVCVCACVYVVIPDGLARKFLLKSIWIKSSEAINLE